MILVTVGTTKYAFPRLMEAIKQIARAFPDKQFIVQTGTASAALFQGVKNVTTQDYFNFSQLQYLIKKADLVVCHAGMGTIIQCHMYGKKPLVIPRQHQYHEHANDHELAIAAFLARKQVILAERDPLQIARYITNKAQSRGTIFKKVSTTDTINIHNRKRIVDFLDSITG